jgi:hypothetical protein
MADTDVKRSDPSGATLSPPPSPSAVAFGTPEGPRIRHLQTQPVASRVYQAIADVNGAYERLIRRLQSLQQFNFFPAGDVTAWLNQVLCLQAEANSRLLESLDSRELNNAAYYDRLCIQRERELRDPDDVLLEADYRRQELAEEEEEPDPEEAST